MRHVTRAFAEGSILKALSAAAYDMTCDCSVGVVNTREPMEFESILQVTVAQKSS